VGRLGLGVEAADADLREAVRGREVPERGVVGDDRRSLAVRQTGAEVLVQCVQLSSYAVAPAAKASACVGSMSASADRTSSTMRAYRSGSSHTCGSTVRLASEPLGGAVVRPLQRVENGSLGFADRVLDAGLEAAAQIDHEVGRRDRRHLGRRELEVVGLDAGRREVRHQHQIAPHLPGRLGERIEAGDYLDLPASAAFPRFEQATPVAARRVDIPIMRMSLMRISHPITRLARGATVALHAPGSLRR
jgi:hypothetical protein